MIYLLNSGYSSLWIGRVRGVARGRGHGEAGNCSVGGVGIGWDLKKWVIEFQGRRQRKGADEAKGIGSQGRRQGWGADDRELGGLDVYQGDGRLFGVRGPGPFSRRDPYNPF